MKVGIFGSEYQIERQNLIKRLFEKLREQEADIYVDSPFYTFLTDAFGFEPVVSGLLVGDEFDLDIALSVGGDGTFLRTAARVNKNPRKGPQGGGGGRSGKSGGCGEKAPRRQ